MPGNPEIQRVVDPQRLSLPEARSETPQDLTTREKEMWSRRLIGLVGILAIAASIYGCTEWDYRCLWGLPLGIFLLAYAAK